jgi:hypothetical protein
MQCYTCGSLNLATINTWRPDPDEPGEWLYTRVCRNCDRGCDWEDDNGLTDIARIATSYGLPAEHFDYDDGSVTGVEWSIDADMYEDGPVYWVTMWSGSWPLARDYPQGGFRSVEDAVRHIAWLIKRENFYAERDDALYRQLEES